jgi:hypothetical protein
VTGACPEAETGIRKDRAPINAAMHLDMTVSWPPSLIIVSVFMASKLILVYFICNLHAKIINGRAPRN